MPKESEDLILEETLTLLFKCHRVNPYNGEAHNSGLEVFNRLLSKSILGRNPKPPEIFNIQKSQISSFKQQWSTDRLKELLEAQTEKHEWDIPRTDHGLKSPVIVAEYEGINRLLDGRLHINMWFHIGNTELHEVHLHEVTN